MIHVVKSKMKTTQILFLAMPKKPEHIIYKGRKFVIKFTLPIKAWGDPVTETNNSQLLFEEALMFQIMGFHLYIAYIEEFEYCYLLYINKL